MAKRFDLIKDVDETSETKIGCANNRSMTCLIFILNVMF